jgi:hypothetical protein
MAKQIYPQMSLNESALHAQHPALTNSKSPVEPAASEYIPPAAQPSLNMGRSLAQIVIVMLVLLMLVNIPFNNSKAGLAQLLPQTTAVVISEGLLLKGSGPEIYRVEGYKLRRIDSPEVFERYFNRNDIVTVEDSLIEQFGQGQPIHRLVKCQGSPTIYALENGQKRWVKYPSSAGGANPWDRAITLSCAALRRLPDGLPIPENAELSFQP